MLLYAEPYLKRFKAPLCSVTGLCVALILAALLVLPFLTGFYLNGTVLVVGAVGGGWRWQQSD